MKKFFVFLLCLVQMQGFCSPSNSNNTFDITINDIPPGGSSNNKSEGLSGGAVTAITIGSIFGGLAAGGVAYYFYKKGVCLTGSCVWDRTNPLIPICGDRIKEYLEDNYPCLKRAIENENICLDCSKKKYIFIKDSAIKNKTFVRFYFKNEDFTKIKVIQYSKSFMVSKNMPELDIKIFIEDKEITLNTEKMNPQEGLLIKKGKLTKNEIYFLDTSFAGKSAENVFAIILEFEK